MDEYYSINLAEISIHALREESDFKKHNSFRARINDFNPRSPRGERRYPSAVPSIAKDISIHALREESDSKIQHNIYS